MRNNLFRAKSAETNKWVEGSLIEFDDNPDSPFVYIFERFNRASSLPLMQILALESVRVKPETKCEYTGINDKNGKKIFEGDIISSGTNTFVVEWLVDQAKYVCKFSRNDIYCELADNYIKKFFTVIGNIYDNPELLLRSE